MTLLNKNTIALWLASVFFFAVGAQADEYKKAPVLDIYTQECASCHMAYPPDLLPVASWQRIMDTLDKHYGVDATLDKSSLQKIKNWLSIHAEKSSQAKSEPPKDRITLSKWFLRKHNSKEISASVWKRASIGTPANCNACHINAAQGDFNEDNIRIPK